LPQSKRLDKKRLTILIVPEGAAGVKRITLPSFLPRIFFVSIGVAFLITAGLMLWFVKDLKLTLVALVVAMMPVLVIKLQKSPYDIAHAHTEIVSGPQVEYSGPYLGVLEIAHWVELALVLWIIGLFWYDGDMLITWAGRIALVLGAVFLAILLDNSTTRLTRNRMVTFTLAVGMGLVALNLVWVVYIQPGVGW